MTAAPFDPTRCSFEQAQDEQRRRLAARACGLPLSATWDEIRRVETARVTVTKTRSMGTTEQQLAQTRHDLEAANVVIEHIERPEPEKVVQRAVYTLYVDAGCRVFWLSQARRTGQTRGLPDLYVFHERAGASWWHEVKPATGDLTLEQRDFQRLCAATLTRHVTGGVEAAKRMLTALGIPHDP